MQVQDSIKTALPLEKGPEWTLVNCLQSNRGFESLLIRYISKLFYTLDLMF
jgi:hypothetical protein